MGKPRWLHDDSLCRLSEELHPPPGRSRVIEWGRRSARRGRAEV